MLYDLGMTVLLAFGAFCVIAWGCLAVIGITRLPELLGDASDGAVRISFRILAPKADKATIDRWEEGVFATILTVLVGGFVFGLAMLLKHLF